MHSQIGASLYEIHKGLLCYSNYINNTIFQDSVFGTQLTYKNSDDMGVKPS